jgi:hypothetical protein
VLRKLRAIRNGVGGAGACDRVTSFFSSRLPVVVSNHSESRKPEESLSLFL